MVQICPGKIQNLQHTKSHIYIHTPYICICVRRYIKRYGIPLVFKRAQHSLPSPLNKVINNNTKKERRIKGKKCASGLSVDALRDIVIY